MKNDRWAHYRHTLSRLNSDELEALDATTAEDQLIVDELRHRDALRREAEEARC